MQLSELRTNAALMFGDTDMTHVQEAQWTTFANIAERAIAKMSMSIVTRLTSLTLTADTYLYDINTIFSSDGTTRKVLRVLRILLDKNELFPTTEDELTDKLDVRNWRDYDSSDSGEPTFWYITEDNKIGFHQPPDSDNISNFGGDIAHLPTSDMSLDADEPQLHDIFHDDVVLYMVYLATVLDGDERKASRIIGMLRENVRENMNSLKHRVGKIDIPVKPNFSKFSD
jgi:hypothetical protein